ncbi:hypothetical protein CR513_10500, partial [Mucuna pruriens]
NSCTPSPQPDHFISGAWTSWAHSPSTRLSEVSDSGVDRSRAGGHDINKKDQSPTTDLVHISVYRGFLRSTEDKATVHINGAPTIKRINQDRQQGYPKGAAEMTRGGKRKVGRGASPGALVVPQDVSLLYQRNTFPFDLRHRSGHPGRNRRIVTPNRFISRAKSKPRPIVGGARTCANKGVHSESYSGEAPKMKVSLPAVQAPRPVTKLAKELTVWNSSMLSCMFIRDRSRAGGHDINEKDQRKIICQFGLPTEIVSDNRLSSHLGLPWISALD